MGVSAVNSNTGDRKPMGGRLDTRSANTVDLANRKGLAETICQQIERMTMFHRADTHRHWLRVALLSVVVLWPTAFIFSPSAVAKFGSYEACVASNGLPLSQVYGFPVSIVTPVCNQVRAGERWAPSVPWIMNTGFERVSRGFASDWATPQDDFRGKLGAVNYVIDPGSASSFNHLFPSNRLWVGELPEAAGLPAVNTVSVGALEPLPVGQHVVNVYWDFTAPHCDGFGTNLGPNCLPAGETLVRQITFNVVAP